MHHRLATTFAVAIATLVAASPSASAISGWIPTGPRRPDTEHLTIAPFRIVTSRAGSTYRLVYEGDRLGRIWATEHRVGRAPGRRHLVARVHGDGRLETDGVTLLVLRPDGQVWVRYSADDDLEESGLEVQDSGSIYRDDVHLAKVQRTEVEDMCGSFNKRRPSEFARNQARWRWHMKVRARPEARRLVAFIVASTDFHIAKPSSGSPPTILTPEG